MIFSADMTMPSMLAFVLKHGYAVLFLWVFLEQIGLPIGAAPVLLAVGALAGYGKMNFLFIFLVVWIAAMVSDLAWFFLGKYRGGKVVTFLCRVSLSPDFCVGRTKALFDRQGVRFLLVAKFLPGINSVTAPLAGVVRMKLHHFIFWDTLGIVLWVIVYGGLGFQFRRQLEWIANYLMNLGNWLGVILFIALAVFMAGKFWQRRRMNRKIPKLHISPREVKERIEGEETPFILDVRSPLDIQKHPKYIPGARHLPLEKLPKKFSQIPRDRDIILYCA